MNVEYCQLKRKVLELKTGPFGSALSADEYIAGGVPLINPSDLRGGRVCVESAVTVPETVAARLSAYRLREGDLVLGRRGELGRYGLVGASEAGFVCGTGSLLVRPGPDLEPRYFGYYLDTEKARAWLRLASVGTTMENLSETILARLPIPIIGRSQQRMIADYLDRKTSAIDALIAKKELLIEELRKYQESVITELVSRGLDPDVELIHSRVPGLGPIPKHWHVVKTGRVLRYLKGVSVPKENLALEGEPSRRFLRTGDFWNVTNREKDEVFVPDTTGLVWKKEGDLVVCFDGFNFEVGKGTVGMARFDGEGYIDNHLELIEPVGRAATRRFLEYVHCSAFMESAIVSHARGAIALSSGHSKYELRLPLPPVNEQLKIVERLSKVLLPATKTADNAKSQIIELQKYKASVISEAVKDGFHA